MHDPMTPHRRAILVGVAAILAIVAIGSVSWLRMGADNARRDRLQAAREAQHAAEELRIGSQATRADLERFLVDGSFGANNDLRGKRAAVGDHLTGATGESDAVAAYDSASASLTDVSTRMIKVALPLQGTGATPLYDPDDVVTARRAVSGMATAANRIADVEDGLVQSRTTVLRSSEDLSRALVTGSSAAAGLLVVVLVVFQLRALRRMETEQRARDIATDAMSRRATLETGLARALEMSVVENDAWTVVDAALTKGLDEVSFEVLVSESGRAHFRRVATRGESLGGGCQVGSPASCPAAQRGQQTTFAAADGLDACPFLRSRELGGHGAACTPVSVGGKTVAVIHAVADAALPVSDEQSDTMSLVARKSGERVELLRAMADTRIQADFDPLTGLLNRRSFLAEVNTAVTGSGYAVLFVDVDRFKLVNDSHGHDVGDRALRVLAAVLRDTVRPGDVVGRYGGEEFVVVAPGASQRDGVAIAERVRESLAIALHGGTLPSFTLSAGVAVGSRGELLDMVLGRADAALLEAKDAGRNRVVADGQILAARASDPAVEVVS